MRQVLAAATLSLLAFTLPASTSAAPKSDSLVVPIKTSAGEDAGTATFKESKDGKQLSISLKLKNLPFGDHAVHIHQNAVCDAPDFKGAGGHFNQIGRAHV